MFLCGSELITSSARSTSVICCNDTWTQNKTAWTWDLREIKICHLLSVKLLWLTLHPSGVRGSSYHWDVHPYSREINHIFQFSHKGYFSPLELLALHNCLVFLLPFTVLDFSKKKTPIKREVSPILHEQPKQNFSCSHKALCIRRTVQPRQPDFSPTLCIYILNHLFCLTIKFWKIAMSWKDLAVLTWH